MRRRITNTQSLSTSAAQQYNEGVSDATDKLAQLPSGEEVKGFYDTVTGWASDFEDIVETATPAAERRERALEDAAEDREEEVVDILMDADEAH